MADSLKASVAGIKRVDVARKKKGWTKTVTLAWCEAALTSRATLKRFWRGEPVRKETFIAICKAVGIQDWSNIAEVTTDNASENNQLLNQDWGEAPNIAGFYGRNEELFQLSRWIEDECCQRLTLFGDAGIGKTYLSAALADAVLEEFQFLIWRSLQNAPSLTELLENIQQFFRKNHVEIEINSSSDLMEILRYFRCLLVLDQVEAILLNDGETQAYRPGYKDYGELFKQIGIQRHQSCLITITQERLPNLLTEIQDSKIVRSFNVCGLSIPMAQELLEANGLFGSPDDYKELIQRYEGNPQALILMSTTIRDIFTGNVSSFLQKSVTLMIPKPIQDALDQRFKRLSDSEKAVMLQLAESDNPLSYSQLLAQTSIARTDFPHILQSLKRRSLIETFIEESEENHETLFFLQLVIRKHILRTWQREHPTLESGD